MNVSLKWLGTLVDIKGLDPEEMAEILGTMLLRQLNFAPGPA